MDTLGDKLRAERERLGLSQSELAAALNMRIQILEDLERNDYHRIPAAIYGKGFIRLYAEYVNLDLAPLLEEFTSRYNEQSITPTMHPVKSDRRRRSSGVGTGGGAPSINAKRFAATVAGWLGGLRSAIQEWTTGERTTEIATRLRLKQFLEQNLRTRLALIVCFVFLLVLIVSGVSQWLRRGPAPETHTTGVRRPVELTHDVPEPYLE